MSGANNYKYYPAADGGFIGSADGTTQICDFREGMGERFGEVIARALTGPPRLRWDVLESRLRQMVDEEREEYEDAVRRGDHASADFRCGKKSGLEGALALLAVHVKGVD